MAVIKTDFNVMNLPMAIERNNPIPLDSTAVWYDYNEMHIYAMENPTAYIGQILSLVSADSATAYVILNTAGDLQEVGAAVVTDNKTIVLDEGIIAFKDFGKRYYRYVAATETSEATYVLQEVDDDHPWKAGLEPKVASEDGQLVLGWYESNPTTIEGVNSSLASLQTTVADLSTTVEDLDSRVDEAEVRLATVYSKTEVDNKIASAVATSGHLSRKKVDSTDDIQADIDNAVEGIEYIIYMVPALEGLSQDVYDEYMVIDGVIEKMGSWEVSLEDYATKDEVANKVDKVDGYELIAAEDNVKLATIESGAQKNFISSVSSNFNVADGLLELIAVPDTIDLSKNATIADLQVQVENKVTKETGKSLVADDQIEKLANLPSDAEKNVINDVSDEFAIDENRVLSIVSVSGSKLVNLESNETYKNLSIQVGSNVTDIEDIKSELAEMQISIAGLDAKFSNYVTTSAHQTDIDRIMAMLTWQDLEEPTTE